MTETWRSLLVEFDVGKYAFVWETGFPVAQKIFEYLNHESVGDVEFESCIQDILNRSRNEQAQEQKGEAVIFVLNKLMYHLSPKKQLLFVRASLRHLAEELYLPNVQWGLLCHFLVANKIGIKNLPQVRQLRSLGTKLFVIDKPFYHENFFIIDQLLLIPKIMRMSRLERMKWFHLVRKPKWLEK